MRIFFLLQVMRGVIFFLIMLVMATEATAQDYAPVRAGDTAYFGDLNPAVKDVSAIAISAVEWNGTDSVLRPFYQIGPNRTFSGLCDNLKGDHWLGRIVKKSSGEYLFISAMESSVDTIRILSNAKTGDKWEFNRSTFSGPDTAIVQAETTKSFLGVTDSVKVIRLKNYGDEIWLSKNYGLIRIPVSGYFMQVPLDNYKGKLIISGHSRMHQGIRNLSFDKVYDFVPGDEIHITRNALYARMIVSPQLEMYHDEKVREIKILLHKQVVNDTLMLTWKRRIDHYLWIDSVGTSRTVTDDTVTDKIAVAPFYNSLPGQTTYSTYDSTDYSAYMTRWKSSAINNRLQLTVPNWNNRYNWLSYQTPDSCVNLSQLTGCIADQHYYDGLGGPYFSCDFNPYPFIKANHSLVYYKKGAETWGTPLQIWMTGEKEPEKSLQVTVSPNPATEMVNISLKGAESPGIDRVQVVSLQGKVLLTQQEKTSQRVQLNISALASGIYLVKISSGDRSVIKKLVVTR